ncbi:MAG: hypothetical protein QG656_2598 [Candidatus Hydrogenedentes bacterium]|nr:hypothetical protein [Candidatus Hydrogenedentota bacterium]
MTESTENPQPPRWYFVDESGDGVLFGRQGKLLLGCPGFLRFFILGLLDVANPEELKADFDALRVSILADPYYEGVPSIAKTARAFHAKDDLPEIRREVFRILLKHDIRFSAVVKDLHAVADYVRSRNISDTAYRYHPDELYDLTVRRLFKERLHKEQTYRVFFARRGKTNRTHVLQAAMETVRDRFCKDMGIAPASILEVNAIWPHEHIGLQAVDYFLWALQRLYNKEEERFIHAVWDKVSLVIDVDDTRKKGYGEYYSRRHPIEIDAIHR